MESNNKLALIEAVESLIHASGRITAALEYQAVGSMEHVALTSARNSANHAAEMARAILNKGR